MQQFFLHNILIRIVTSPDLLHMGSVYSLTWNYHPNIFNNLLYPGDILIQVKLTQLELLLNEISQLSSIKPNSITILVNESINIESVLLQYFKLNKAAGGIVIKGKQILMIYRANMWDLPKGRIENGESAVAAAVREVNEECGVHATPTTKFYTTWHAFQTNGISILKETTWYIMDCIDDTHMAPQKEEAIERVAWINIDQLQDILKNTYTSIQLLLQAYQNHTELKKTLI